MIRTTARQRRQSITKPSPRVRFGLLLVTNCPKPPFAPREDEVQEGCFKVWVSGRRTCGRQPWRIQYLYIAQTPFLMNNFVISAPETTASVLHNRATEQNCFQLVRAQSRDERIILAPLCYAFVYGETLYARGILRPGKVRDIRAGPNGRIRAESLPPRKSPLRHPVSFSGARASTNAPERLRETIDDQAQPVVEAVDKYCEGENMPEGKQLHSHCSLIKYHR